MNLATSKKNDQSSNKNGYIKHSVCCAKSKKKLENKMEEKYNEEIANDICQRTLIKRERINYVIYKRIVLS